MADSGLGIDGLITFFEEAMTIWAHEAQCALLKQHHSLGFGRPANNKRVLDRPYLPDHEDCDAAREPWADVQLLVWNRYNWKYIRSFNRIFDVQGTLCVAQIFGYHLEMIVRNFLQSGRNFPIDRPGGLRPDAGIPCIS